MDELERVLYYGPSDRTMPIPNGNQTQRIPRGNGVYRSGQVWMTRQEEVLSHFERSQRPSDAQLLGWALGMLLAALLIVAGCVYLAFFY
jgi:hypothetical protein